MARQGFHKLTPGELESRGFSRTSERYVNTWTGETISRRQYDNERLVDTGWNSRDDYERRFRDGRRTMAGYTRWRDATLASRDIQRRNLDKPDSEFNRLFLAARAENFDRTAQGRRPNSAFAKFLVYTGLRSPGADYPVGGS